MATPNQKLQRIGAGIVLVLAAAVSSGCAARASYEYDEPVVYRRGPVYSAPPPVVVYRDGGYRSYHSAPPAPYRGRVGVYRAPIHVHQAPPAGHEHHDHHGHESRHSDHDERHHR
jgi:hypothetical protein